MNLKRAPGWGRVLTLGCQGAIVHCSVQKNPTNSNPLLPLLPFTESQQSRADSGNFSTTLGLHRTQPPEPPSHLASTLYPPPTSACPFPAASALWPWPFSRPQLPHESNVEAGGGVPLISLQLKFSKMSPLWLASLSLPPFLLENNTEFPPH